MHTPLMNWKIALSLCVLGLSLSACQKEDDLLEQDEAVDVASSSRAELTLDSVYLYAKEIYLWNESLPEYAAFSPRQYATSSSELENLEEELFALTQYSMNPASGRPYEWVSSSAKYPKFSFIEEKEASSGSVGTLAGTSDLDGTATDYGFALSSIAADDIRVRYVHGGSPAATAGLSRGDVLLKVDGKAVRADSQADINRILSFFKASSFPLTVQKADGTIVETTLAKTTYKVEPVFKSTTLTAGAAKVGYLAYSRFSSLSNSRAALEKAFADFAADGVSDLVIDLRYNGGGYVSTAEFLLNQIAPGSLTGKVMYKEIFNELMQQGKADILKNQRLLDENDQPIQHQGRVATYADVDYSIAGNTYTFKSEGPLETVENVYFIMGENTASASELVINALKPHMNVTLLGATSFGKPVGFFGMEIDKYSLYVPNFSTVNANNEGDYYTGFTPDVPAADDVTRDFGDPKETSLSMALSLIDQGSEKPNARIALRSGKEIDPAELQLKHLGGVQDFQGMIETRRKPAF